MTKDQLIQVRKEFPHEVECMVDEMYGWPTSRLVNELIRWLPKSEFMKQVYQWEKQLKEDEGDSA
jgi:hypothetical protein